MPREHCRRHAQPVRPDVEREPRGRPGRSPPAIARGHPADEQPVDPGRWALSEQAFDKTHRALDLDPQTVAIRVVREALRAEFLDKAADVPQIAQAAGQIAVACAAASPRAVAL